MKTTAHIGFIVGILATAIVLCLAPYDESRVALLRLDSLLRQQNGLKEEISHHCSALTTRDNSQVAAFFLEHLAPVTPHPEFRPCVLSVESAQGERFHLRSYWSFLLHVQSTTPVVERHFNIEFPRPLCFLPIAFFVWALLVGESFWGLWLTLATYVFILGGLNLTRTTQLAFSSGYLALTSDTTALGLVLIAFWLALMRHREETRPSPARSNGQAELLVRQIATFLIGIWNPLVYTLFGRALVSLRGGFARLRPFLDTQLFVACLSLFVLSVDFSRHQGWLESSVFLPRYFSCAALSFMVFRYTMVRPDKAALALDFPPFWRGLAFVAITELAAWRFSWLGEYPRLMRVGASLVLSELLFTRWHGRWAQLGRSARALLPWAGAIFIAAFFVAASRMGGATDMAVTLLTPQVSADSLVFATFLAGLALGFLTGSFSLSFFSLYPTLLPGHEAGIVKAALLDGILAGNLLSPLSLFNLVPAAQLELGLGKLIKFRFQQVFAPLLIGGSIYAVSSLNSIAILQPVTFVFLCLVAFTFQMRQSRWRLTRFFQGG